MAVNTVNEYGGDAELAIADQSIVALFQPDEVDLINKQWSAYTRARDAGHLDWVEEARKFDDFYYGQQWDTTTRQTLDAQRRPHHTVNLILSTVNAVTGEYIRSRQDIAFKPMGKGANPETAKSLHFLFKQIALNNDSEVKEQTVFLDGLIQDRGYFYYYMDFSDHIEGEVKEIVIDPTDIILDPGAKEYDPETWSEVFISRWMTPEEIGGFYGEEFKNKVDLAAASSTFGHDSLEWEAPNFSGDHYNSEIFFQSDADEMKRVKRVRVIERQYKKLTRTGFFVDNTTGDMRRIPQGWSKEKIQEFLEKMQDQISVLWKSERRVRVVVTADRTLLHDDWSIFNRFSIVPFFPYFRRGRPFGLVRNLISPQEMLNKVTSQELHVVNTTANSGWMFKTGTLVNMDADDLAAQGSKTGLVLEWTGDAAPEKIQPNSVPTGLDQISSKAGIYFREISGVNEAMLGAGRSDSSKALESRRQGGLVQQEIVFDHLDYTRKLRAKFLLDAVQMYYSETRLIQIFSKNEDGDEVQEEVELNQPIETVDPETQMAVEEIKNDLTIGEYSVVISSVPRRDTYDEMLFSQLIDMRKEGVQIPDHILIENSSLPDRKEVAEQIKSIQGLAAPTEAEVQKQQQIDDLQMRGLAAEVALNEAHAMERQAKAQLLQAEAQGEIVKPQLEAGKIESDAQLGAMKIQSDERAGFADLQARLELMRMKTGSAENVATVQSATKRMDGMMNRQTELDKTLITAQSKSKESSNAQG